MPRVPITIGITVTFIFLSFFQFPGKFGGTYPFSFLSILLSGQPRQQSLQFCKFSFFCWVIIRSGRLGEIRWSVCMSKSLWSLCVSFSRTDSGLCIYHLFVWSYFNFLHNSQRITLPTQLCLVLHSFCANLLLSLIMWLIVSSLSPHNQHLLFSCVLSILVLIWLVLMALFCAAYNYFYYFIPCEFFPSVLNGLSREFKWLQVSSDLQDSFKYSSWSQQCCSLDGLDSTSDFQFLMFFFHNFFSKCNFYYHYYHIYQPLRSGRIWHKVNF